MGTPRDSAGVEDIWTLDYLFDYWENRIQKLDPENPHDALDAIFIHSHLADVYVTALTARINRPNFAWYVIKNELPTREIYNTLETLEETVDGKTRYYVEKLLSKPEEFVTVELPDSWEKNIDYETAFVNQFIGCPADFNTEEQTIQPRYDPQGYMAVCNAVINYWDETRDFLNDFKHGFRVIPFSWERLEWLYENNLITVDIGLEEVRANYTEPESDWTYDFWRMEVGSDTSVGIPVQLEIRTADITRCIAFSKLTLKLIFNLFDRQHKQLFEGEIEDIFGSTTVTQGENQSIIHKQYSLETRFYENSAAE